MFRYSSNAIKTCSLPWQCKWNTPYCPVLQVSIANGSLEYDVGILNYIPPYNCSNLANSCSSCMALNISTNFGFQCDWCVRDGDQDAMCLDANECSPLFFPMSGFSDRCPPPLIRYAYSNLQNKGG